MDNSSETESNDTSMSKKKKLLLFEKCTPLDDVTPWCYTRVDENGTYILGSINTIVKDKIVLLHTLHSGQWGYCSEDCTGEKPDHESEYNLAINSDLWTTGLYDLSTWGAGNDDNENLYLQGASS